MSFRLNAYSVLLDQIMDAGRASTTVAAHISRSDAGKYAHDVILRHDVDRMTPRAVAMAELEAKRGIQATYYFRCSKTGVFPNDAIRTIAALGHETGYHYECLSACRGNHAQALEQFEQNLTTLRTVAPCITVSMHGAPMSPHNNQDLLAGMDLGIFGVTADASLAFSDSRLAYFTDTGGLWNGSDSQNFRDRVGMPGAIFPSPSSPEFKDWLRSYQELVYVSTHPERWASNLMQYVISLAKDKATAVVKTSIRRYRSL